MTLRGGYTIGLQGRPGRRVVALPEVDTLYLPLRSRRFAFSTLCVEHGDEVHQGQVLAKDPDHHFVPLLAPRGGTIDLESTPGHVVLGHAHREHEEPFELPDDLPLHVPRDSGSSGMRRYKLLMLGAWQFVEDACTGALPDPFGTPRAVIVSTLQLEPFAARGDVQLAKRLTNLTRGLEQIQSLLEYQPIHLVLPDIQSEFATRVRETIRGYAWAKLVQVPLRYPFDNFTVLARHLGLTSPEAAPVWALRTEGLLAFDRVLTQSKPCNARIVSLGGPAASAPGHLRVVPGYPLQRILAGRVADGPVRVVNGGALTGRTVTDDAGLDCECTALTVLPEHEERELLGFARPGWGRRSYSPCFLSALRGSFAERLTTALRGENRPCVACGACEEVCPASIMPHMIHKALYNDQLDEAREARVDLCVACGLCSFVCPSKIELREQFVAAKDAIRREQQEILEAEA